METPLSLIMLGGDAPGPLAACSLNSLLKEHPYVVAADRGAEHLLRLGIMPHLLIGDGDSLPTPLQETCRQAGAKIITLPRFKDLTDGEAAFAAAIEAGYRRLALFGAFGGRPDHLLGNVLLPLAYKSNWESCTLYGEGFTADYCFGERRLTGQPGDTVSLIVLSPTVQNLTLQGFCYPLQAYQAALGCSRCLCNRLKEASARVTFDAGTVLIIHYRGQAV